MEQTNFNNFTNNQSHNIFNYDIPKDQIIENFTPEDQYATIEELPYYTKDDCFDCSYLGYKYVGWKPDNECIRKYFSKNTVRTISNKVTELTRGVNPQNRPIIVPDKNICSVMSQIYLGFRPPTSDIYSRYNIPRDEPENYVQRMIDQCIELIVSDIKNNLGIEELNSHLNIWSATVLGDFNTLGLRSHSQVKVRDRHPSHMGKVSFMSY
jgi:hypothetical protein